MPYLIIISCVIIVFSLLREPVQADPEPEKFPIIYPLEPMFENYVSIAEDIRNASTRDQIYACYVRFILFSSCYDEAQSFVSELYQFYMEKEALLIAD